MLSNTDNPKNAPKCSNLSETPNDGTSEDGSVVPIKSTIQ